MHRKIKNQSHPKSAENKYASESFNVYAHSAKGVISTSASVSRSSSRPPENGEYHVKNKAEERIFYATKQRK